MPTITLTNGNDTEDLSAGVDDGLVSTIVALDGDDTVIGGGVDENDLQADLIYGGDGSDSLTGAFGDNTVFGGIGDDILDNRETTTEDGIDTIYGGAGDDSIFGKQSDDIIYGGEGDDTISSNLAVLSASGGITGIGDTVYGGAGNDVISTEDGDGNVSSIGDIVYGGADDDSIIGAIESPFAATIPEIDDDQLFGGTGDDTIDGNGGTDSIDGGAGNDTVISADDADTTTGGDGIDTINFAAEATAENAAINFNMETGETTITGATGTDVESNVNYEIVYGGQLDDTIIGSSTVDPNDAVSTADNLIYGGAGADSLVGGAGSDTFFSGAGSDSIDGSEDPGDPDVDVIDYSTESDGVIVNYSGDEAGTAQGTSTGVDTFQNIERIIFTGETDIVDAGNDTVGVTLDTGAGNDFVNAGQGADSLDGGDGDADTLSYFDSETPVNIDAAAGTGTGGRAEGDEFANFENFQLSAGDDNFNGTTGNDTVDAGDGNDNVAGGAGADSLDGGAGDADTLDYSGSAAPVTVDLAAQTVAGGDAEGDVIAGFEGASGSAGDDNLTGDDNDNTLDGNDGNDTLDGAGGDDSLVGGDGDDSIDGGDGNDTIDAGGDDDTVDGGIGDDSIDGGDGDDSLGGGDGEDTIAAGEGNDTINGGEGDDSMLGDGGDDLFQVGPDTGDDSILGGETGETNGDTIGVSVPVGGSFVVVPDAADPEADAGQVFILDAGGNTINTITYDEIENIVCFTRGTMIQTPSGEVAIEDLAEGDMVMTRDNGARPLRWIGSQSVAATGKMAPVTIKAGALGNDRDLKVSQLHRMLVTDWRAELMFDETEVLACAKHLVNGDSIFVAEGGEVEYFHMLFDNHEIVTANGAESESFHPGEQGMSWLEEEMREEIFAIFPELRVAADGYGPAARPSLKAFEARALKR